MNHRNLGICLGALALLFILSGCANSSLKPEMTPADKKLVAELEKTCSGLSLEECQKNQSCKPEYEKNKDDKPKIDLGLSYKPAKYIGCLPAPEKKKGLEACQATGGQVTLESNNYNCVCPKGKTEWYTDSAKGMQYFNGFKGCFAIQEICEQGGGKYSINEEPPCDCPAGFNWEGSNFKGCKEPYGPLKDIPAAANRDQSRPKIKYSLYKTSYVVESRIVGSSFITRDTVFPKTVNLAGESVTILSVNRQEATNRHLLVFTVKSSGGVGTMKFNLERGSLYPDAVKIAEWQPKLTKEQQKLWRDGGTFIRYLTIPEVDYSSEKLDWNYFEIANQIYEEPFFRMSDL